MNDIKKKRDKKPFRIVEVIPVSTLSALKHKHAHLDNKVCIFIFFVDFFFLKSFFQQLTAYKYGFDAWDIEVQDNSEPEPKKSRQRIRSETATDLVCKNNDDSNKENINSENNNQSSVLSTKENLPIQNTLNIRISEQSCDTNVNKANAFTFSRFEQSENDRTFHNNELPTHEPAVPQDFDEFIFDNYRKPLLFAGKYFEIVSKDDSATKAKCMTCQCVISGTKTTTSNFITHLKVRDDIFFSLFKWFTFISNF